MPVVELQIHGRQQRLRDHRPETNPSNGDQFRNLEIGPQATFELLFECAIGVSEDHSRDRLQEGAILVAELFGSPNEDTSRSVEGRGIRSGRTESNDQVLQFLTITRIAIVPDDQIHRQSFDPPVAVGLHELPHQLQSLRLSNSQEHNREVARDPVSPQPRLAS